MLATTILIVPTCSAYSAEVSQRDWLPTISGFGTAGVIKTDDAAAAFRRSGQTYGAAGSRLQPGVDSNFGLQADQHLLPWLSAMVQVVAMRRDRPNINVETEWAFLRIELANGITVRTGRLGMPTYELSDRRFVGYAQTAIRPPEEVYELDLLRHLDGADVRWNTSTPVGEVELQALGGKSKFQINQNRVPVDNVAGLSLTWHITAGISAHAARIQGEVIRDSLLDHYTFSGVGVLVDQATYVAQAEYVIRHSEHAPEVIDAKAWYVSAGWHFGRILPYGIFAKASTHGADGVSISAPQKTTTAGVRWDLGEELAVKIQVDHVNSMGGSGVSFALPMGNVGHTVAPTRPVNVIGLAFDFIF